MSHFDTTVVTRRFVIAAGTKDPAGRAGKWAACRAKWGACTEWYGRLTDHYGSTAACVVALASEGIIPRTPRGGPVSREVVCNSFGWVYFGILQVGATFKDFSGVSEGAREDVADFVHIWEVGEAEHEVEDLADVLEDLLGIKIGGLFDDRLDEVQQGLLNLYALFGAQGRRIIDVPANRVIVTKRRVRGLGWAIFPFNWHAALEFPLAETYGVLGYNPTIAAYNVGAVNTGKLVNKRNDISERNNLFAGTVTLEPENFFSVWIALSDRDRNYCKNLDYAHPFQAENFGPDEYNSNGYIAGIINSIGGSTDAPISSFFLGDKPVPVSEFQRSTCD